MFPQFLHTIRLSPWLIASAALAAEPVSQPGRVIIPPEPTPTATTPQAVSSPAAVSMPQPATIGNYYGGYGGYAAGAMYGTPGGYEARIGSPYHYTDAYGGQFVVTGDPYYDHFGPGFHRHSLHGHYRFPYYTYRAPWYYPGRAVYNRDTNFAW